MNNENTIKDQLNDSEENARLTAVLRDKLKADIKRRGLSAYNIFSGKYPNPYPIGKRSVWVFANDKEPISNAHKWLMFLYFEQQGEQDETEQAESKGGTAEFCTNINGRKGEHSTIEKGIKTLEYFLKEGYKYTVGDFFGLDSFTLSKGKHKYWYKFYTYIYNESNDTEIEIPVDVLSYDFEVSDRSLEEGQITMIFKLKPKIELPKWFLEDEHYIDNYYESFENVPLCKLFAE